MSLIVATPTYMVCDSFLGNDDVQFESGLKVFTNNVPGSGGVAVGVVGSLSASRTIARMIVNLFPRPAEICDELAKHIDHEYQVLVADGKELWESNEAGDTFRHTSYGAIGQGYQYALGACYALEHYRTLGPDIIDDAIYTGSKFSPMVSPPFHSTTYHADAWFPVRLATL